MLKALRIARDRASKLVALSDPAKAMIARVVARVLVYGGLGVGAVVLLGMVGFAGRLAWESIRLGWRLWP